MHAKVDKSDIRSVTVQIFVDKTRTMQKETMHYQIVPLIVGFLVLTMKHSAGITPKRVIFL